VLAALTARRVSLTLFFLLVLLQPLQWYAIADYGEPYPTLTFPTFAGAGRLREAQPLHWEPTFTAHWASGALTEVPRGELFAEVPEPTRWRVITLNFGPDRLAERKPLEKLNSLTSWLPGRQHLWRRGSNSAQAREAAPWLRSRLEEMYVGQRAVGMTIRWQEGPGQERKGVSTFIKFDEGLTGRD
jgi:hypothetical protein